LAHTKVKGQDMEISSHGLSWRAGVLSDVWCSSGEGSHPSCLSASELIDMIT